MTATDAALGLVICVALAASISGLRAYARFLRGERAAEEDARASLDSAVDQLRKEVSFANLLDFFRRQIDQFYIQGRRRANWSFTASLIAMSGGLVLAGATVFAVIDHPDKVMPAVATAAIATLTSFIVKTFIEMSSQADRSLGPLYKEAFRTMRFLMAPKLVASLKDAELGEQTVEAFAQQFLNEIGIDSGEISPKRTNHHRPRSPWIFR